MDRVQGFLEIALICQKCIYRADIGLLDIKENTYRALSNRRDADITGAVKELLDGEYLQVVFDAILKSIIKKVEREFYPIEGR